jgi:tetratricopeptide (TPR) repeat protein
MSSQPENEQIALENVTAGGDINATISQEIHHEPSKLADKIGVVAQSGSAVNIGTFIYNQIIQEAQRAGSLINLPQTNVTFFAGRDDDLKKVHELLQKNQRVAVAAFVKGMGGVGKSELALQYALRHLLTDYSGGIFWLRGNEGTLPTQLQDFVQVQLGEKMPDGLDSGEKLAGHCWRRLLERVDGQMLVVLDDVKDYGKVEPFLPPLDGKFRVLVTTRLGLGNAMQQYTLDVLVLAAAVDLLKSFLPEADPRRQNDAVIEKLCEWLGRLPLAIELVGRYLARKPDLSIAKMQERLDAKKLQQDALTDTQRRALAEMTAKLNVAAAFDLSWQELSEGAQRLACLLSLFALAPIHWQWVMDAMGDVDEEDLETCRDDELLNLHLLERKQQGVYELHQLLREYFQFQLKQHLEWSKLRQLVVLALLSIAKRMPETPILKDISDITPAIPHLEMMSREMLDDIPNPEKDNNLIWVFEGIGRFYYGQGLYSLAEDSHLRCLKSTVEVLGERHLNVSITLNNLAELYRLQRRYVEAEPLYQKSLSLIVEILGSHHLFATPIFNNLAIIYKSQGRYEEAERLYQKSLVIRKKTLGNRHPDVASNLNNLAELYDSQCRYEEAELLFNEALVIMEEIFGDSHPNISTLLNNLAGLYKSQMRYEDAELLYQKSLSLAQKLLGNCHPDVAQSFNNLAGLYCSQGRYEDAELLYQKALTMRQALFGECHPEVSSSLSNLAGLYYLQGRLEDSGLLYQKALTISKESFGENHPDIAEIFHNLATVNESLKKYELAEFFYQKALALYEKLLEYRHPNVLKSLNNLAVMYLSQGRYQESEPLYLKAQMIRQELFGECHPDVATSFNNLAMMYFLQGRHQEAEPLYLKSLVIRKELVGECHPDIASNLYNLAVFYHNTQRHPEALQFIQCAIQIYERKLGTEHPNTQAAISWLQPIQNAISGNAN